MLACNQWAFSIADQHCPVQSCVETCSVHVHVYYQRGCCGWTCREFCGLYVCKYIYLNIVFLLINSVYYLTWPAGFCIDWSGLNYHNRVNCFGPQEKHCLHLPPIYQIYCREINPVESTRVHVHCKWHLCTWQCWSAIPILGDTEGTVLATDRQAVSVLDNKSETEKPVFPSILWNSMISTSFVFTELANTMNYGRGFLYNLVFIGWHLSVSQNEVWGRGAT